jgi:hypothetical protein
LNMSSSSLLCQNIGLLFTLLANVLLFPNICQQIFVTTFIYAYLVLVSQILLFFIHFTSVIHYLCSEFWSGRRILWRE